nr:MAG TPA: hypothetical protein [Caudoviricetes sp.]
MFLAPFWQQKTVFFEFWYFLINLSTKTQFSIRLLILRK